MPRPFKCRRIKSEVVYDYFKPRGIPVGQLKETVLAVDELEAVRLAHVEGLYQEDAARIMGVSRQTFGNIIESGHKKIAGALVFGRALRIEGGKVVVCGGPRGKCRGIQKRGGIK